MFQKLMSIDANVPLRYFLYRYEAVLENQHVSFTGFRQQNYLTINIFHTQPFT